MRPNKQLCAAFDACQPFLKMGETPAECLARNRMDIDRLMGFLAAEKTAREALQADARRYRWLREHPLWVGFDSDYRPDQIDKMKAPSTEAAEEMGAKGGTVVEEERLAFEAWMRGHCWPMNATWTGGQYLGSAESSRYVCPKATRVRGLWAVWRDRAELAADEMRRLENEANFYRRRCEALQAWQSSMRDPERVIVCDILANGFTLDQPFAGDRYAGLMPAHQTT